MAARFGSSIHYEASVKDHAGHEKYFDISWPVEDEIVESLQSAIDDSGKKSVLSAEGMDRAKDVVGKALIGAQPYIFEAGPWQCSCGRTATEIHHSPLLAEEKIKLGIVVDKPEMICDNPACKERALGAKLAEHASHKKGYKMTCIYHCCHCEKTGVAEDMKRCGICMLAWYCSDECKKAHIRNGHNQEP